MPWMNFAASVEVGDLSSVEGKGGGRTGSFEERIEGAMLERGDSGGSVECSSS